MIVYLIAVLESLAYLAAVPVCAVFCVSGEGGLKAGAGVGAFRARGALRRARRAMAGGRRRRRQRGEVKRALALLRRLKLTRISLRGQLGLGDAAATALLSGALTALAAALRGRTKRLDLRLSPDFSGELRVELRGMICARAGQIMLAAAQSGFNEITGRIAHGKAPD